MEKLVKKNAILYVVVSHSRPLSRGEGRKKRTNTPLSTGEGLGVRYHDISEK
jgi:hypothetical protein